MSSDDPKRLDRDEYRKERNSGASDASEDRMRHEPWWWLESDDHFEARTDAYNEGYDETMKQKDESSGGICLLTTACVEYSGMRDDCHELTVLRRFRDNYVARLPQGNSVLAEYYRVAPVIVERIQQSADRDTALANALSTVRRAVEQIEAGQSAEAFALYTAMFSGLKRRYYND